MPKSLHTIYIDYIDLSGKTVTEMHITDLKKCYLCCSQNDHKINFQLPAYFKVAIKLNKMAPFPDIHILDVSKNLVVGSNFLPHLGLSC